MAIRKFTYAKFTYIKLHVTHIIYLLDSAALEHFHNYFTRGTFGYSYSRQAGHVTNNRDKE